MCSSGILPWVVRLFKTLNQNIASLQIKEELVVEKKEVVQKIHLLSP